MKRNFKNKTLAFAVTAFCLATCGLITQQASASETAANDITNDTYREANFTFDGYSVRIPSSAEDAHGYGVKFYVRMTKALYDTLPAEAETGTLFLPEALIGVDEELTIADTDAWDCPTTDQWYAVTENEVDYVESVVYCYEIPEENYGSDIAVRGYVKIGDKYYYSATNEAHSMSWAAKLEYNNEASKLTGEQKEDLKAEYLDCKITLDGEEYATVMYGEKITEPNVKESSNSPYYYYNTLFTGFYRADGTAKWDFENDTVKGDVKLYTFSQNMNEGELEDFSTFDSYVNLKNKANTPKTDGEWLESKKDSAGTVRYGVASTASASGDNYKHFHISTSAGDTTKTLVDRSQLEFNMGKTDTDGNTGAYWYYESIWVLIDVNGEVSVNFGGGHQQKIQGGVWSELKLYKSYLDDRSSGLARNWGYSLISDSTYNQYTFLIDNGNGSLYPTSEYPNGVTVYVDSMHLENGVAIATTAANNSFTVGSEIMVAGDYNGNGADVNANNTYFQSVSYTYEVKNPLGGNVTVSADGKFTPTISGNYEVTVTATAVYNGKGALNGKTVTVSSTETVSVAQAANILNAFDTEADTAACGWKGIDSNGAFKNEKQWLTSHGTGDDVRYGVLQLTGWTDTKYRNYFVEADSRWTQTSLKTYLDTAEWDYLSVWVWVDVKGEVTVVTIDGSQKVSGRAWVELKMDKAVLTDSTGTVGTTEALSKRLTNSNDYLFYITTADNTDGTNITVYIDSVSLEKNA